MKYPRLDITLRKIRKQSADSWHSLYLPTPLKKKNKRACVLEKSYEDLTNATTEQKREIKREGKTAKIINFLSSLLSTVSHRDASLEHKTSSLDTKERNPVHKLLN